MAWKIGLWLGISVVSGAAYHLAGLGGFPGAKLLRRVICPILALYLYISLSGGSLRLWWAYLAFLALNFGALSTYHDYLAPKGENWLSWLATGFIYGLAALPLIWCGAHLWAILGRSVFLAITITWLRTRTGKAFKEEFFSGFLYCATTPLLLV